MVRGAVRARCAVRGAWCGWAELGREPLGVAREHRGLADVVEVHEEHHHALEPDAAARVRVRAVLEGLDVVGERREVDLHALGAREQHRAVVDALCAGGYLLAADEDVVRVGDGGVAGVGHGVEGAQVRGELIDHVEVDALDAIHHHAEQLLVARRDVLELAVRRHRRQVRLVVSDELERLLDLLLPARRLGLGLLHSRLLQPLLLRPNSRRLHRRFRCLPRGHHCFIPLVVVVEVLGDFDCAEHVVPSEDTVALR
mmetsp:Transcript_16303/g.38788  ORF Transcript_16303/g.38788 Transcript_16303/m.38788 type:complete len:256 (-) Transcript_16303:673-1440(-)